MPVRSLNSSVLKWPNKEEIENKLKDWVKEVVEKRKDIVKIGYFGSYAKGNYGVGSDLDIIIILEKSSLPFMERAKEWDLLDFPVPVDLLIYTLEEWEKLEKENNIFFKTISKECVWIFERY